MKEMDGRLGDGRHPGDNLVVMVANDRFLAINLVFNVIFSYGWYLIVILGWFYVIN